MLTACQIVAITNCGQTVYSYWHAYYWLPMENYQRPIQWYRHWLFMDRYSYRIGVPKLKICMAQLRPNCVIATVTISRLQTFVDCLIKCFYFHLSQFLETGILNWLFICICWLLDSGFPSNSWHSCTKFLACVLVKLCKFFLNFLNCQQIVFI